MPDADKRVPAIFFQTEAGQEPVRTWLLSLDKAARLLIGTDIKTVEYGWPLGMPLCRPVGKGIWETRSNLTGSRIARVLFCLHKRHMVLLHGFIKKSRQLPKTDFDLACQRKSQLEER